MAKMNSAFVKHDRVQTDVGGASMTRQEFAEECDVNALMARYDKVGAWPFPQAQAEPQYLDVSEMPENLQDAMNMMMEADAAFMRLPAVTRREFDNSALKFVEFAQDPKNIGKLREWGLAEPLPVPAAPLEVRVVGDKPPPGAPADKGSDGPPKG